MTDVMVRDVPRSEPSRWSPYLVGAGIGVLSWVAFAVFGDPLGVTTAYSRVASLFALPVLGPDAVAANSYWKAMPLKWDYGVWFLVGIPLGAFLAAIVSGTWRLELVPEVWKERFGPSVFKRFVAAFFGGIVIMYGARLAGGCTSGHGISGGLQLAVSSWLFLAVMFATGLLVSRLMFRKS
ncbi:MULTISPECIES: YeeE/YedE thiosulfate transporter family protein [unclassified Bradyrhizobium]|uniref:YeeE/YedE thiosulfate transporter family protein n=1 Tax=unclassified Bradyrhizobium TaxID=2631580 RepID=UPI0028E87A1F|nr:MULTISPECIES: YeeE/YedE thiosulfate transporter family protein [unclassified Bradyrhizobium]